MRKITPRDKGTTPRDLFSGRRIEHVDTRARDVWRFHFDDGGSVDVEVSGLALFARATKDGGTNQG